MAENVKENEDSMEEEILTEESGVTDEGEKQDVGKDEGEDNKSGNEEKSDEASAGTDEDAEGEGDDTHEHDKSPEASADKKDNPAKDDKRKGFFKKKDKRDEQIADLNDRVKRQMAEFENFRKRSEKEKAAMYDMGVRSMLEKILPVVDNFERGLAGVEEDDSPFAEGMRMVYKQLMTTLEDAGVTEIEAIGCEFDPERHNAVMHIDDDAYGENEIVEVMQKGFMYHDAVVRYSMVKVAN